VRKAGSRPCPDNEGHRSIQPHWNERSQFDDLHRLLVAVAADPGPIGETFEGMSEYGRLRLRQLRVRARASLTDDVAETAAVVHMTAKLACETLGVKGHP
jgi:hypothetical protein